MSMERTGLDALLESARAHMGAGHNAFVHVPGRPLMKNDAATLPLGAMSIAVKDVIDCENMPTQAGSKFTSVPVRSARIIDQLVAQGGAVVGKTQAHQFSFGTTGDVSFAGPVRNALDETLMAGGSSGGSAVAVALGVADAAVGTDTAGSVRIPAALNSVVGFKPTYDAMSSDGIFPLSPSLDTPGFIARDVSTIRSLMSALDIGADDALRQRQQLTLGKLPDISMEGMASSASATFSQVLHYLGSGCDQVVEAPDVDLGKLRDHYRTIIGWEASMVHGGWARLAPEYYEDEILARIATLAGVTFHEYFHALTDVQNYRQTLIGMFDDIDVLVSPTLAIETPELGQRIVQDDSGLDQVWGALAHFTSPWNVVGFPAISIPIPNAHPQVPVGLQLIGKPGSDGRLLQIADAISTKLQNQQMTA